MFLKKYLNNIYFDLVCSNYAYSYLNSLDEDNFVKIYNLLQEKEIYFIEDIILNYLTLFELDEKCVRRAINDMESIIGKDYVKVMGNNMSLVDKIINIALRYQDTN